MKSENTARIRPEIKDTHKEIIKLQKTIVDDSLIHKEDEGLASVTQLGRTLTQWTYRIKSRVASYQKKTNQKVVFHNYEEAEQHLNINSLSKRQLCSLLHSFYDPSHTLIPQTMVFSRFTWKQLHDLTNVEWDQKIPESTQGWTKLTLYSFFLESTMDMPRYNFSEHPKSEHFLVGLTDASLMFHAYQIFLVTVLHDSNTTRVQLLSSSAKTNKVHDRTVPFYELTGIVEVFLK